MLKQRLWFLTRVPQPNMNLRIAACVAATLLLVAYADASRATDRPQQFHVGGGIDSKSNDELKRIWANPDFAAQIKERVRLHLKPRTPGIPEDASTVIEVCIALDGRIISTTLLRSSGYPGWDRNAMGAVTTASPLPVLQNQLVTRFTVTVKATDQPSQTP